MNDYQDVNVTKNFVITLREVERLDQLTQQTGLNKSELVRKAINELFEKETNQTPAAQPTA